jgi:hypothetical protein
MRALLPILVSIFMLVTTPVWAGQRVSAVSVGSEAGPGGSLAGLLDIRWGLTQSGQLRGGAELSGGDSAGTHSLYLGWNQWWAGAVGTGKARYAVKEEGVSSWALPLRLDLDMGESSGVSLDAEPEFYSDSFTGESGGSQAFGAGLDLAIIGDLMASTRVEWGFLHGDRGLPADFWARANRQSTALAYLGISRWAFGVGLTRVAYFREESASWILDANIGFEGREGWSYDLSGDSKGIFQLRVAKEI